MYCVQDEAGEVEDVEMEVDETEPDQSQRVSDDKEVTPLPPPTPLVPSLSGGSSGNLQIRKDYDPKGQFYI